MKPHRADATYKAGMLRKLDSPASSEGQKDSKKLLDREDCIFSHLPAHWAWNSRNTASKSSYPHWDGVALELPILL